MKIKSGPTQGAHGKECREIDIRINRRELLQLATIAVGVAMSPFPLPSLGRSSTTAELVLHGNSVKMQGTPAGKILASHDEGITWKVAADFGSACPVLGIRSTSTGVQADIGHKGYNFTLHSIDGRHWSA